MTNQDLEHIKFYTVWATVLTLCLMFWLFVGGFFCNTANAGVEEAAEEINALKEDGISAKVVDGKQDFTEEQKKRIEKAREQIKNLDK